jgi:hypothetical protein
MAYGDRVSYAWRKGKGASADLGAANAKLGNGDRLLSRTAGYSGWTRSVGRGNLRYGIDIAETETARPVGLRGKNGLVIAVVSLGTRTSESEIEKDDAKAAEAETTRKAAMRLAQSDDLASGEMNVEIERDVVAVPRLRTKTEIVVADVMEKSDDGRPGVSDFDEAKPFRDFVPAEIRRSQIVRAPEPSYVGGGWLELRDVMDKDAPPLSELAKLRDEWLSSPPEEPDDGAMHRARLKAEAARMEVEATSVVTRLFGKNEWERRKTALLKAEKRLRRLMDAEARWKTLQRRRRRMEKNVAEWKADVDEVVGEWLGECGVETGGTLHGAISENAATAAILPYAVILDGNVSAGERLGGGGNHTLAAQAPLSRWKAFRSALGEAIGHQAVSAVESAMLSEKNTPELALKARVAVGRMDEALSVGIDLLLGNGRGRLLASADSLRALADDAGTGNRILAAAADRFHALMRVQEPGDAVLSDMTTLADVVRRKDRTLGERMRAAAEGITEEERKRLLDGLDELRRTAGGGDCETERARTYAPNGRKTERDDCGERARFR